MPKDRREAVAGLLLRLRTAGIMEPRLFKAFEAVPRQNFVPIIYLDQSYDPGSFPIECGQTMPPADRVARTLLALEVGEGHRVLEVGTGSGYQTALLAHLGNKVTSLERFRTLADKARIRLETLKIDNAVVSIADGIQGIRGMLFDRIILNGSLSEAPRYLVDQLASNGILIVPVGPADGVQKMMKMTKIGSRFEYAELFDVRVQPLATGTAAAI